MSATGHQVLSFVTSGEMIKRSTRITRSSLAFGEPTEAKDTGCAVELVMPAIVADGFGSLFSLLATTKSPKVTADTAAYKEQSTCFFAVRIIDYFLQVINFALIGQIGRS